MNKDNYRNTFKSTTIFALVQLVTIVISVLKSKTVALWLGPYGLGLISLFTSITGLVYSVSNLGLSSSGVKQVAASLTDRVGLQKIIMALRMGFGNGYDRYASNNYTLS